MSGVGAKRAASRRWGRAPDCGGNDKPLAPQSASSDLKGELKARRHPRAKMPGRRVVSESDQAERKYVSPGKLYDVFLSHASEDKPYVRQVAERLKAAGLAVYLDENEMVAGRSLRAQLDYAILNSRLGVLFISPNFILKRWPREEFDALFTLEDGDQTRILPVWLNVSMTDVRGFSPMLAARFALQAMPDANATAAQIVNHVEKIYDEEGSWAQRVRIDTRCLPWVAAPVFLPASLKILDDCFPTFWNPARPESELPTFDRAMPLRVGDLAMQATRFDGQCVIVIGRQEKLQFYEQQIPSVAEYVFQLLTRDPAHQSSIVYVRYVDVPPQGAELPAAPAGHLTVAVGFVIASGAVTLSDSSIANCAYLVAAAVYHVPDPGLGPG